MKKVMRLSLLALTVVVALAVAACSSGNSPVEKLISLLDKTTEQMKSCDNLDEVTKIIQGADEETDAIGDDDYVLTDNDKERLAEAYTNLVMEMTKVAAKAQNEPIDDQADAIRQLVKSQFSSQINSCDTFGDFKKLVENAL